MYDFFFLIFFDDVKKKKNSLNNTRIIIIIKNQAMMMIGWQIKKGRVRIWRTIQACMHSARRLDNNHTHRKGDKSQGHGELSRRLATQNCLHDNMSGSSSVDIESIEHNGMKTRVSEFGRATSPLRRIGANAGTTPIATSIHPYIDFQIDDIADHGDDTAHLFSIVRSKRQCDIVRL